MSLFNILILFDGHLPGRVVSKLVRYFWLQWQYITKQTLHVLKAKQRWKQEKVLQKANFRKRQLCNWFVFALLFNCDQVKYKCLRNYNKGILKRICERSSGSIYCPEGTSIDILSANYGRTTGRHICPDPARDTHCRASGSLSTVKAKCQGRSYCYLKVTNSLFGRDPCQGTKKYLEVRIL